MARHQPSPTEFATHCALVDLIRHCIDPAWRFTHFPAGEHRNIITAARLKRMGMAAGWPVFLFAGPNRCLFFLELKRKGGRLSEAQADVAWHLRRCGFDYYVASSFEDAKTALLARGILRSTLK